MPTGTVNTYIGSWNRFKGRDHFGDLGIDGRECLKGRTG